MTVTKTNPYLEGNYAPIRQETTAEDLKIIGELPREISGMFLRNGPNPQFSPIGTYHWFDGDGMIHGVRLHEGKASYCNRYVRTQGFQTEQEAGTALWKGLLESSEDNPDGATKNVANTALVWHDGQLLALWEGGAPHAVKIPELQTIGLQNYNKKLSSAFTAHPKVDPVTGEMMFFGYSLFQPPFLQYSLVSPSGELLWTIPIDLPMGVMMHDFAITEHYTIFMDLPLTFSVERMQRGEPPLRFEADRPSRFGMMPRHGDQESIRWFEAPSCYVFHTLNAYEAGDEVVLIACRMNSTNVLAGDSPLQDREGDIPRLHRWRFNLTKGTVVEENLELTPSEFPALNDRCLGYYTRYGYTAQMANAETPLFSGMIKHDFDNKTSQFHRFGEGRYGGDPAFVPRRDGTEEDDGWVLTFVHDTNEDTSELVVIDGKNFTADPVTRVIIPQRVPYGFHSVWVTEEQLQRSRNSLKPLAN